ncbi:MAG TPA: hypothetical protein VME43_17240, partial [Bryobacteraceae bacterium]|nr:hypothetical protein [Bryobacteraceae bacterium]
MTGCTDDPLLLKALHDCLSLSPASGSPLRVPLDFVEAVWRAHGSRDTVVGTLLANAYLLTRQRERACGVVASLMEHGHPSASEITQCLGFVIQAGNESLSNDLIIRYKDDLLGNSESAGGFWHAWARAVVSFGSKQQAAQFRSEAGPPRKVSEATLADYCEILLKMETGDPRSEIAELLPRYTPDDQPFLPSLARRFWRMIDEMGLEPELRKALSRDMSEEEVSRYIREGRA